MNHASPLQKLQGAIDGRGLGGLAVGAVAGDQVIGLDRLPRRQQQLQYAAPRRGHAFALGGATGLDRDDGLLDLGGAGSAVGMIVIASNAHASQLRGRRPHRNRRRRRRIEPTGFAVRRTVAFAARPAIG